MVIAIVAGIAFMETSHALGTREFWREFGLKLFGYGLIAEFSVVLLGQLLNKD